MAVSTRFMQLLTTIGGTPQIAWETGATGGIGLSSMCVDGSRLPSELTVEKRQ